MRQIIILLAYLLLITACGRDPAQLRSELQSIDSEMLQLRIAAQKHRAQMDEAEFNTFIGSADGLPCVRPAPSSELEAVASTGAMKERRVSVLDDGSSARAGGEHTEQRRFADSGKRPDRLGDPAAGVRVF